MFATTICCSTMRCNWRHTTIFIRAHHSCATHGAAMPMIPTNLAPRLSVLHPDMTKNRRIFSSHSLPMGDSNWYSPSVTTTITQCQRNILDRTLRVPSIAPYHRSPWHSQLGAVSYFSSSGDNNQHQHPPPQPSQSSRWAKGAGLLGAASLLFGKTKYVLAALKVTKFASLGSMVLSIGAYSMIFGWPYACGMVGLIFVHECGHAIAMHKLGMPFSPMVFIPFMGAVIATRQHPRDAWEDALIAAGGPILGSIGAATVAVAAHATDSQLLYALADFGFMVNLFNLLPIGSMDGGRWAGALSKYVGVAGVGLGGFLAYNGSIGNPLFYLILLAGTYETFMRFYDPAHLPPNFYKITNTQRVLLTGGYFGLIVALLAAMNLNQQRRKSPEQIRRETQEPHWDMRY